MDFSNCHEGDVAVLANELSKMVSRLSRTRDQLSRERNALADSLADVSHQIRTPLAAITLMLPVVERADDARERKRAVRELESMIERVSWLVTTLLKIAKVDAGAMHVERREVSAADVARRAVAPPATAMAPARREPRAGAGRGRQLPRRRPLRPPRPWRTSRRTAWSTPLPAAR